MGKTSSICLYPPLSAFPQPWLPVPRLPERGADTSRKTYEISFANKRAVWNYYNQRNPLPRHNYGCVHQGTKPSYLASAIHDSTEFCWTVRHGSREKNSQSSYNWGPLPRRNLKVLNLFASQLIATSRVCRTKNGKRNKENNTIMMLKSSPSPVCVQSGFKFTLKTLHLFLFSPVMDTSFNKLERYRNICLFF